MPDVNDSFFLDDDDTVASPPDHGLSYAEVQALASRARMSKDPDELAELSVFPDDHVRRSVAINTSAPGELLTRMANDETTDTVLWGLAENPSLPSEVLVRFATDPNSGIRDGVAHNPAVTPEILETLMGSPEWTVRGSIADSTQTTPEQLARLAGDAHPYVRKQVTRNARVPLATLVRLATDPENEVRIYASGALHSRFSIETLAEFFARGDYAVRRRLEGAPTTKHLLREQVPGGYFA